MNTKLNYKIKQDIKKYNGLLRVVETPKIPYIISGTTTQEVLESVITILVDLKIAADESNVV